MYTNSIIHVCTRDKSLTMVTVTYTYVPSVLDTILFLHPLVKKLTLQTNITARSRGTYKFRGEMVSMYAIVHVSDRPSSILLPLETIRIVHYNNHGHVHVHAVDNFALTDVKCQHNYGYLKVNTVYRRSPAVHDIHHQHLCWTQHQLLPGNLSADRPPVTKFGHGESQRERQLQDNRHHLDSCSLAK